MKIKVMIVDDEYLERTLIKLGMDWTSNGFEIIGEADSGELALKLMENNVPDILFTDICMPFMDGLELIDKIREKFQNIKIVIITGHREFDYAQRALKLGVTEFLLKPINHTEVSRISLKLKEEILNRKKLIDEYKNMKNQLDESLPVIKEKFFNELILGKISESYAKEKLSSFNINFLYDDVMCATIKFDIDMEKGNVVKEEFNKNALKLVSDSLTNINNFICFHTSNMEIVVIMDKSNISEVSNIMNKSINSIIHNLKCDVTIGLGNFHHGVNEIAKSYNESISAVKARVIYGKNQVIHYSKLNILEKEGYEIIEADWNQFSFYVKNAVEDKTSEFIKNYIDDISRLGLLDIEIVRMLSVNVVSIILAILNENGKKLSDIGEENYNIYEEISKIETLKDMEFVLKYFVNNVIDFIKKNKEKKTNKLVESAKTYINENLANTRLSLKTVAKYLFVNDSYLSRIFKVETDESITEYITKLRINKSIEYLNSTDLKAYEIAELIGISDAHYFSICFKKYMGKSINEYRKGK